MKKRLHNNGEYICDFECTGDYIQDAILVDRLLTERGLKQVVTPQQTIFRQANSFMTTSALLYEKIIARPPDAGAVAPFVVNAAFALELYLKTLALQHGKTLRGHELEKLFKKLPANAKQILEQELSVLTKKSDWADGQSTLDDLRRTAVHLNSAFIDWRYLHEKPQIGLKIDFRPTIFLGEVLHAACQPKTAVHT
ncbi:hypothetical protein [Bradyrhizobium cenepequi]|uniref:hypothetical protein n=1 Tax=Bradyrhizobium cenepequi TaxID=2821403 RepID=UPI001CE2B520|nr:hypothetical protein [Bradyrhizobium cenepequi]MCA6107721.1 hypothetical protein [Bradyrhizobium cenepequi]